MVRATRQRRGAAVAGFGCALLLVGAAIGVVVLLRDPRPRIEQRRSTVAGVTRSPAPAPDSAPFDHRVELVQLRAASGLVVELAVKRRADDLAACERDTTSAAGRGRTAVLLLGGHRTGRNAVNLIADTRGTVVAAMSYPFAGNHRVKGPAIVGEVPRIRTAILDTPAAVMLAVDHLIAQPCVDPERVELVGVSLGAPFVIIAGAMDSRVARVWAVHGAGGVRDPLEFNLRRQVGSRAASVPLAALATLLLGGEQLAPERWIGEIAPRPVVMINALEDERIPRASVERLYRAARDPKEMIWMPGMHVRSEAEAVRPLIDLVLSRITTRNALP